MVGDPVLTVSMATAFILATSPLLLTNATDDPVDGSGLDTALVDSYAEVFGHSRTDPSPAGKPGKSTSSSLPKTVRTYLPACYGNWPDKGGTTLCPTASLMCAGTPDPNDIGFWVFSAPAGPTTADSWTATGEYACLGDTDPEDPPPVIPVLTGEDFQRLPLPASPIVVQPPNRRTLVNVPTNLYADSDTVTLPTTVLGQPVRVRATPEEFRWTYGDGGSLATADAGAAYPVLRTAHVYREAGARRVGLTTVYSGQYSVNGGPWLPVDGVATVASPVSTLDVISAENRLVAGSDE